MGKREGKDKLKVQGQKENSGKASKKTSKSLEQFYLIPPPRICYTFCVIIHTEDYNVT